MKKGHAMACPTALPNAGKSVRLAELRCLRGVNKVLLKRRVALVTGASRGIGKEIALSLGRAGARVAVSYRTNKLDAQRVVNELPALGVEGLAVPTDITDAARVKEMIEGVVRHFGRLDILVNNVGDFQWKPVI